jgi:competence protein ComEC
MNFDLKLYPALRLLIVFTIGTIAGLYMDAGYIAIIIASMFALIIAFFIKKYNTELPYYLITVFAGIIFSTTLSENKIDSPNKIIQSYPALVSGKIVKTIKKTDFYCKCIVEGNLDAKILPNIKNSRILVTIYNTGDISKQLSPGTDIFVDGYARLPRDAMIPNEFPEKQYATSQDIQWIVKCSGKNVAITKPASGIYHLRDKIVKSIQSKISLMYGRNTAGIIMALMTGDKIKIPYETKKLFSLSGTAHVLAVSGLHVGIIASIIFVFLGFVRNRWLKFVIFSVLVAAFVILTGMPASAMRAGFMAIVIMLANTWQRHIKLLNILAFAILMLVIFEPSLVYSAGFHMSVAAIAGIAILYNPINNFFNLFTKTKNIVIRYFITLLFISFSAGIAVSPIVAYYFDIYSIISPFANLFIVPLMTLGMIFGLIALVLSYIYLPIASFYAVSSEFLINVSQEINKFAVSLPMSHLEGDSSTYLSIIISICMVYILTSNSFRRVSFRMAIAILFVIISINFLPEKIDKIEIYPREYFVAIDLPAQNGIKNIYLIDRKPEQYPVIDNSMYHYLRNIKDTLRVFYCGNTGLAIVDKLKRNKEIDYYDMDIDFQKRLQKQLKINQALPQLIKYER